MNIDVSDAQDAITAIVKAFDVSVDDIESIMDKLVATGNNFPISVAQIAEGMNNASSALAAAGNTFEQSVALLTAANTTIQNAAKSSTGLRTIAARIRNTKTELDDLGEEMSEASYEELVQQLTDFNVALTTANGEYRSTYDIMADIAKQWGKMTSMEQAALATAMSGTRQQAVFYSIIEQFQEAEGAMQSMAGSAGELQKSYDIYLESVTAHINEFKAAFQELGSNTFESDFLKQLVDLGTDLVEALNWLVEIIDAVGGLNTVLKTTIILLATLNGAKIVASLSKVGTSIANIGADLTRLGGKLSFVIENGGGLSEIFRTLGTSAYAANVAVGAVTAAIIVAISLYKSYKEHLEQVAKQAEQAAETSRNNVRALEELRTQLESGSESVDTLTEAFKNQLKTMGYTEEQIQSLTNRYTNLASAIDAASEQALKQSYADSRANVDAQFNSSRGLWGNTFSKDLGPEVGSGNMRVWITDLEEYKSSVKELNQLMSQVDSKTGEGLYEYYNRLKALREELAEGALNDNSLYDSYLYENVSKYLGLLEDDFGDFFSAVENANNATQDYLTTWSESQDFYKVLPDDAVEQFNQNVSKVVDGYMTLDEAQQAAADLARRLNELYSSDYIKNINEYAQGVNSGAMSIEAYQKHVAALQNDYGLSVDIWNAIIAALNQLPDKIQTVEENTKSAADAMAEWTARDQDIPEIVEEVDKWADVAAKAAVEMAENGEISNETVKALSELVDEGEDWLQYLTLENGELKLNVELFKERALQDSAERIQTLEDELAVMKDQSTELLTQIALQEQLKQQDSENLASAQAAYDEMMANFPANPTSYDLGRKSALENYLNHYDVMISGYQFSLDKVEAKITEWQKKIEVLRNTGRSYDKTVADALDKSSNSSKADEETLKTFNWIEAMLDRIQRKVNEFSRVVGSKFKSLSTRNEAAKKEIEAITEEIELQERAYRKYIELCESVNLSDEIKKTIENGAIDISDYDEETAELISQYQEWYEAALDTKEAVDALHESLGSVYDDDFSRIQTDFENRISLLEYLSNMYDTGIRQLETEGYMASAEFYNSLTEATEHNIELLKEELNSLEGALQAALDSGEIEMYSEAWYGYITTMNGVKEAIADANLSLAEFAKTMQEIDWEYFDYLQERISNITDESQFLLDLLGEDNIFKDGKLTAEGLSVLGLRAVDYNTYMAQADKYAQEIAEIEQQLANDPYNRTLLDRREELLELQRQSILAAEDEKDAILDLVQNAIEEELDSIKELIEAYKDALDAAKDLYDYRNKIADETSEIASLQKQLSAYSGDDSEEARATIQQLKDQLIKAQKELEETEYDKYISDQKKLLDNLYAEYELLLNQRMDNTDALLADVIAMVNQNANIISDTLHMTADSVGYTLTDSMQTIWGTSFNSLQNVVTMYGEGFLSQLTTTNQAINNIANLVSNMQSFSNSWANNWIGGVNSSYTPDISGWTPGGNTGGGYDDWETEIVDDGDTDGGNAGYNPPTPTKQIQVGGLINAGSAPIYDYAGDTSGERQYYRNDPIYRVLSEKNGYLLTRWYKLSDGYTGWFKRSDVKAYKRGGLVDETGLMWLDGTKQNPEAVLNSEQTERFIGLSKAMEKLAKNGIDFSERSGISAGVIGKLIGGRAEITPIGGSYGGYTQDVQITIPIDHVFDYDDFISQLVKDKDGRRIIQALALDAVAGKNNLSVNKFIK